MPKDEWKSAKLRVEYGPVGDGIRRDPPAAPTSIRRPKCSGPMVVRRNPKTDQTFHGCEAFPRCSGLRPIIGRTSKPRKKNGRKPLEQRRAERAARKAAAQS